MSKKLVFGLILLALMSVFVAGCGSDDADESDTGDGSCGQNCPVGTTCRDGKCVSFGDDDGDVLDGDTIDGDVADGDVVDGDVVDGDVTDGDVSDGDTGDGDAVDGDVSDGDTEDGDVTDGDVEDGDQDIDVAEPDIDFDFELLDCINNPSINGPSIKVEPNQVDFGAVPLGESNQVELTMCNAGGQDLTISSLQFSLDTSAEFFKFHAELPLVIPPGKASPVYLIYVPADGNRDEGDLVILSDDLNNQAVHIPLISDIKPTPLIEATPRVLQFAGEPGSVTQKLLEVKNVGLAETTVYPLQIVGGESSPYSVIEVTKAGDSSPSDGPWVVEPSAFLTVKVQLTMGETVLEDVLVVPWSTDTGTEETRVDLTTNDMALCATPDAGQDQTVRPLDTVFLDGSLSFDENGSILAYKWEWETKPDEAFRAIIKDSQGNDIQGRWSEDARPNFYAELAGTYVVRLTVKDQDEGCSEVNADTVTIVAVPDETIHIQLVWSTAGNDHDLHLVKPSGFHSRNCSDSNQTDCHWCNCDTDHGAAPDCPPRGCPGPSDAPDWGQIGVRDDDPTLDIDDIQGRGPENINLSLPELGDYLVTVENYSGSGSVAVTVRIWLYGVLQATFRHPTGFARNNHWNVCNLKVHSPTDIEIQPLNTIEPSGL